MTEISVVIPTYNEEERIGETLKSVLAYLAKNFKVFEVIVVDDGSCDHTLQEVKKYSQVKILKNLVNHGKGYTVKKGVLASRGELILFMDADSSTDIVELKKLQPYINDFPVVIASRAIDDAQVLKRQNLVKVFLGRSGNKLIKYILGLKINDTQCGFKLFQAKTKYLFEQLSISSWGFDFELLFLAKIFHYPVKEVPVVWFNHAGSRVTALAYLQTLAQVFQVRINYLLNKYK